MRSRLFVFACVLLVLSSARLASAQQPPLERAKDLFRQGNELRKAGDCGRALAFYLESRSLVPSVANTTNAAVCMALLDKDDEALEMYEELLVKFRADLSDDESRSLAVAMASLQGKLGRLEVSANVQGLLVVDGRSRGQLPLPSPVPLKPGPHVVRVIKEGYATFEQSVGIVALATVAVDAKLEALTRGGRLHVDVARPSDVGADVLVDGALIGHTPWEGTLTPGSHLLVVRKGTQGIAPVRASVVENQTVNVSAALAPLGPEFRCVPEPQSAAVSIDGVIVGDGEWRGALPIGRHTLEARADAHLPARTEVAVTEQSLDLVTLRLAIDPAHPRWATRRSGRAWVEIFGALPLASGLGSGPEASCDFVRCANQRGAIGGMGGVRAGYELPNGLALHLGVGYLAIRSKLSRSIDASFTSGAAQVPTTYDLKDVVDFSGPFASAGVGYAFSVNKLFEIGARGEIGAVLASGSDGVTGDIRGGGRTLDVTIAGSGASSHAAAPFVLPELLARTRFGRFYAGGGVGVAVLLLSGPALGLGDVAPKGFDCAGHPGAADCAPASGVLRGQRAFGPTLVWLPSLEIGATFQ